MKYYYHCPAKRSVQSALYNAAGVHNLEFTGLAGTNPDIYLEFIERYLKPSRIVLCDYEQSNLQDYQPQFVGDIVDAPVTNVMDLDFCDSIVNSGEKLIRIYNKMCELQGEKVLFFTFATRLKGGLARTISFLDDYLFGGTIQDDLGVYHISVPDLLAGSYVQGIKHKQSKFTSSKLLRYREGLGCGMVSGMIKWE